jgi:putative hydrolase of the HAD superfamily
MVIKAVIFNLGGVYFTEGKEIAAKKIAKQFKLDAKQVADVMASSSDFGRQYRRGEITDDEFWEAVKKILFIDAATAELNKIWYESYIPIDGTVEIVKKLKNTGMKVYYLSDSVKERIAHLEENYNFLGNFTAGTLSHKVGLTKHDGPRIFRMTLTEVRELEEDVVFIDATKDYVEVAKSLGMQAILFKDPKQLAKDLKKLKVKF